MQCTDSPSRNKVANRRFDAAFCEVCSVFEASEKMPWASSQLCLVWASFSRYTAVAVYKTEYIRQKNECLSLQIGCGVQLVILSCCLSEKDLTEVQKKNTYLSR